jgi:hypothetical protein
MARRSLKPQLNQIRTWVRQGRTDAWIAHQLEVTVRDIAAFKSENDLAPAEPVEGDGDRVRVDDEPDLRAEDDALVAAALDAEPAEEPPEPAEAEGTTDGDAAADAPAPRRRRGRRGGRGRSRTAGAAGALEGTFDHGEEGYGLWLDPAVQDDPVYAEHWAGHRPVTVSIEADQIVIRRGGEDGGKADEESGEEAVPAAATDTRAAAPEVPAGPIEGEETAVLDPDEFDA